MTDTPSVDPNQCSHPLEYYVYDPHSDAYSEGCSACGKQFCLVYGLREHLEDTPQNATFWKALDAFAGFPWSEHVKATIRVALANPNKQTQAQTQLPAVSDQSKRQAKQLALQLGIKADRIQQVAEALETLAVLLSVDVEELGQTLQRLSSKRTQ